MPSVIVGQGTMPSVIVGQGTMPSPAIAELLMESSRKELTHETGQVLFQVYINI